MKFIQILSAVALTASTAASATTLIDGSFETKGASTPVTDYCYDTFPAAGNPQCAPSAWTGTSGVIISNSGPWGNTAAADGNYYAFVQGLSTLSQSFTATATSSLTLSWLDANRTNNGGQQSYTVSISGGASTIDLGTYTSGFGSFVARTSSPFLAVSGTTYTLTFTGLSAEDRTSFIDGVALAAVPEPATWGLMIVGFGMVGFAARRRRTSVAA
ncbi:FxDxF family PEP-CTERM protein [Glacieibacterium frigidum]|uniref:FxDxF family PEP-CTERM protein n=1 Tax=Glacieibacterium frigidum TaxID=2593303 RepID=UPI00163D4C9E|nr:FxDxF family PEP-CTERM protein [Glacieibacterium frigidum]